MNRERDESANDFNDKAIVKAAVYFRNVLLSQERRAEAEPCKVILITNDVGNQVLYFNYFDISFKIIFMCTST